MVITAQSLAQYSVRCTLPSTISPVNKFKTMGMLVQGRGVRWNLVRREQSLENTATSRSGN